MEPTPRKISQVFDDNIPETDDTDEYKQVELLRDRLASTAYRVIRDLPENPEVLNTILERMVDIQSLGNKLIQDSFKEKYRA